MFTASTQRFTDFWLNASRWFLSAKTPWSLSILHLSMSGFTTMSASSLACKEHFSEVDAPPWQNHCTLIVACKIIAQHIPFLSNQCFLTLAILAKLTIACQWILQQSAYENRVDPCTRSYLQDGFLCVYARNMCVTCSTVCFCTSVLQGSHTAVGTGTPTYFMACVWVSVWKFVCNLSPSTWQLQSHPTHSPIMTGDRKSVV